MLNLQEIFLTTELKGVISIEDAWTYSKNVEAVLFDMYMLPQGDKALCLQSIKQTDVEIYNKIVAVLKKLEEEDFKTKKDASGIIKKYVSKDAGRLIDNITSKDIDDIEEIVKEYGLSLNVFGIESLQEIVCVTRELGISFRVYTDFLYNDKTRMEDAICKLTADRGYVLCIIDDQLNGSNRASEIIKTIESSNDYNNKVICVLLTSNDNTVNQKFNNNIFVEYVKKGENDLEKRFKKAYLCSLYRIMLTMLQTAKMDAIKTTFESAYSDEKTANFISGLAVSEGVLNFDYILKWLNLKEKKQLESKQIEVIKSAIKLSNALNLINDDNTIEDQIYDEEDLYKFDTFDLTVNKLYKPIDIGDVFEVRGKYYILIGQECDLAVRSDGERKTKILEFVSAKLRDNPIDYKKIDYGYEQAIISKFPVGEHTKYIVIDCGGRYYGKTDIFDMCTFNEDGVAQISLGTPLQTEVKALTPEGMTKIYENIQKNFNNLNEVKSKLNNDNLFSDFGRSVGLSTSKNEVIDYFSYEEDNNNIKYNVKRLCRLRKHANLLHKLYLSYRGRQAEEAVCFSRSLNINYVLGEKEYEAYCLRSTKNDNNEYNKLHGRCWVVKSADINEYLIQEYKVNLDTQESYLLLDENTEYQGFKFKKSFDKSKDRLRLTIEKI